MYNYNKFYILSYIIQRKFPIDITCQMDRAPHVLHSVIKHVCKVNGVILKDPCLYQIEKINWFLMSLCPVIVTKYRTNYCTTISTSYRNIEMGTSSTIFCTYIEASTQVVYFAIIYCCRCPRHPSKSRIQRFSQLVVLLTPSCILY